LVAENGL